jgi:hypothetical protein
MSEEVCLSRDKVAPITNPDLTNEDPVYWSQVLASYGLSMSAGSPSRKMVPNVGNINDLVKVENAVYEAETGHVKPPGHGPDT